MCPAKEPFVSFQLRASCQSSCCHFIASREVTGKSMLLQKIRGMKRTGDKYPNKYTDTESPCSPESHHLREIKQTSPVQFEDKNSKTEVPTRTQQNSIKLKCQWYVFSFLYPSAHHRTINTHFNHDIALCSDQEKRHYKQALQILKELKAHRPTKSVNKKQPAAETTDVLYDSVSAVK